MTQVPSRPITAAATEEPTIGDESSLAQRLRSLAALAIPALIFWYVGFRVVQPDDPGAPITLLLASNRLLAMGELLGLAIVSAGLAAAVKGPLGGLHGPLGLAVGLATMSLRGGTADMLPTCLPIGSPLWPARSLVFELWLWLLLIGVGAIVGRWVEGWFHPPVGSAADWRKSSEGPVDSAAELRRAIGAVVVVAGLAYLLNVLLGGRPEEQVLKGQVFFATGAAFFVATWVTTGLLRLSSPLWLLVAVALVGTLAYLWARPIPLNADAPLAALRLLLPNAVRPLPAEYAALGTIGVIYGFLMSGEWFERSETAPARPD